MSSSSPPLRVLHEPEDIRVIETTWKAGLRIFVSAVAFVAIAFVFAFFYLKAVNTNGQWRPAHVTPSQGYGIGFLASMLAASGCFALGRSSLLRSGLGTWRFSTGLSLGFAIAGIVLGVLQITDARFGVTGGGYASVYYGWNAVSLAFWLGAVYWIETLLAASLRAERSEHVDAEPLELVQASSTACLGFLVSLAAIALVAYALLYLIK